MKYSYKYRFCIDFVIFNFIFLLTLKVNMELEAFNLKQFSRNFAGKAEIAFPNPILEYTDRRILVESFHSGSCISEYLDCKNSDLKHKIAKIGVTAVLKMVNVIFNFPGESFILKFIPNQSEIFRIILEFVVSFQFESIRGPFKISRTCNPNESGQFELIRVNPNFQSEWIRSIRINLNESGQFELNPSEIHSEPIWNFLNHSGICIRTKQFHSDLIRS